MLVVQSGSRRGHTRLDTQLRHANRRDTSGSAGNPLHDLSVPAGTMSAVELLAAIIVEGRS